MSHVHHCAASELFQKAKNKKQNEMFDVRGGPRLPIIRAGRAPGLMRLSAVLPVVPARASGEPSLEKHNSALETYRGQCTCTEYSKLCMS